MSTIPRTTRRRPQRALPPPVPTRAAAPARAPVRGRPTEAKIVPAVDRAYKGFELAVLGMRVSAHLAGYDGRNDLNHVEWEGLRFFAGAHLTIRVSDPDDLPARGDRLRRPDSAAAFARFLGVHLSTASRALKELAARGLVALTPISYEGGALQAGYRVNLTREGLRIMAADPMRAIGIKFDQELSASEKAALLKAQTIVMRQIQALRLGMQPGPGIGQRQKS